MTAADHLQRALDLAADADHFYRRGGAEWMDAARTAAELGRLHLDIHRELILRETLAGHQDATVHPLARSKRKAPASPGQPAGAHDTNPLQEA